MERSPITPENTDEKEEKTSKRKRRSIFEVVGDWLDYRNPNIPEQTELHEQEDDDAETSKTKRLSKFLLKLFGRDSGEEGVPVESTGEAPDLSLRLPLINLEPAYVSISSTETVGADDTDFQERDTFQSATTIPESTASYQEAPERSEMSHGEQPESDFMTEQTPEDIPQVLPIIERQYQVLQETGDGTAPEAIATPIIPKHEVSSIGSLAAERITRLQEKNKKEIAKHKKEIKHLKQAQVDTEKNQDEHEQKIHRLENAPLVETKTIIEKPIEKVIMSPGPEHKMPPQPQTRETTPTIIEKPIIEKVAAKKQAEKLAHSSYEQVKPEAILEQVEAVAEKNVALEGLFERRHEVKDDSNQTTSQSNDQQGGMHTVPAPYQEFINPVMAQPPAPVTPQPVRVKSLDQTYKKAAVNGVVSAVVLLAVIIVMFLLFR